MVTKDGLLGNEGNPTYLDGWDPDRTVTDFASKPVAAKDYVPLWLNHLAEDATLEGTMMNGAVRGANTIRTILSFVRSLYEGQQVTFAGPFGEEGFLEVYNTRIRDHPIGSVVVVTRNLKGEAQHIAASYRPRSSALIASRILGVHFSGTPIALYFNSRED